MNPIFKTCWAVVLLLTAASLLAGCVTTPEEEKTNSQAKGPEIRLTPNSLAEDGNPPITIGSFAYSFIKRGGIHMNVCREASCVPGSRVSYVLYGRTGKPDFEEFKLTQGKVFSALKARASEGVTMNLSPAERSSDETFTIYTSVREARSVDGETLFTNRHCFIEKARRYQLSARQKI